MLPVPLKPYFHFLFKYEADFPGCFVLIEYRTKFLPASF